MSEERELRTRRLFASARREGPSAALRARVLAVGLQELEQPPRSPSRVTRRLVLRWTGSGVVAGLALAAAVLLFLGPHGERFGPTPSESIAEVAISAEPHAAGARGVGAVEQETAKQVVPVASPPPEPAPELPAVPPSVAAPSRPEARRAAAPARVSAAPAASLDSGEAEPAPPQAAERAAPSSLSEQLAQLQRARSALRSGQAAHALELLDTYQGQLEGQTFGAEATLLRIEALAATRQRERAAELARRFLHEYPNSPLVDRAQSLARELSGAGGAASELP